MPLPTSYDDPIDLFRATIDALNRENWRRVAELCDAATLEAFKSELLGSVQPPPGFKLTTAEMLKAVPNMPRAVAEYQVQRFREHMDPQRRLRDELPSVESVAALTTLRPSEVFAAWLDGRSMRREAERAVERKHMTRAMANEIVADGQRFDFDALGSVNDGPDTCYIVYRASDRRHGPRTLRAARQSDGSWMLVAERHFSIVGRMPLVSADADADVAAIKA